ncbi:MAG: ParA family protein [Nitrospiraceae bacterium]|nr:MAG: ParA family protein [Nitrospiraceae bacterium]
MRKVISVVNLKGGVGKTTSAVNIAACWGEMGKKVLLVDLDPQGSASTSFGVMNEGTDLLEALKNQQALPVMPSCMEEVDLVPAGPDLISANQLFMGAEDNSKLSQCLSNTEGNWDFILIDCPPSYGPLTANALMASQKVIVPVEASFLGLNGLNQMVKAIASVKSQNTEIEVEAVIPCRAHRRRRIHWEILDKLKEMFPNKVTPIVRENVALAEAPGKGKPVILTARISKGADDYRFVTLWLDERLGEPELIVEQSYTPMVLHAS